MLVMANSKTVTCLNSDNRMCQLCHGSSSLNEQGMQGVCREMDQDREAKGGGLTGEKSQLLLILREVRLKTAQQRPLTPCRRGKDAWTAIGEGRG